MLFSSGETNMMQLFVLTQVMSFIHRMVDTLGASVFPYLPKALEQLLAEIEVPNIFYGLVFFVCFYLNGERHCGLWNFFIIKTSSELA